MMVQKETLWVVTKLVHKSKPNEHRLDRFVLGQYLRTMYVLRWEDVGRVFRRDWVRLYQSIDIISCVY